MPKYKPRTNIAGPCLNRKGRHAAGSRQQKNRQDAGATKKDLL
jgi:hypothetical protein